jgi:hypothetical protein
MRNNNASEKVTDAGAAVVTRAPSTRAAAKNNVAVRVREESSEVSIASPVVKNRGKSAPPPAASSRPAERKANVVASNLARASKKRAQDDDGDFEDISPVPAEFSVEPLALKAVIQPKKSAANRKTAVLANVADVPAVVMIGSPDLSDEEELLRLVTIERGQGRCSCGLVAKSTVKILKVICAAQVPPVAVRHRLGQRLAWKDMRKKEILLALCPVCTTEAEVVVAMAGAGFLQGVNPKYWNPRVDLQRLSPLMAFHLSVQRSSNLPENADIHVVLDEFRAHLAKMLSVNFRFYVMEGKINKMDDVGQEAVLYRIDKFSNYFQSVKSALSHYRDVHSDMTCGRLRRGLVCTPFRVFQNCDARVEQILRRHILIFLRFVMGDENLTNIENVYPNQARINAHFGF